jgi:MFS family permease
MVAAPPAPVARQISAPAAPQYTSLVVVEDDDDFTGITSEKNREAAEKEEKERKKAEKARRRQSKLRAKEEENQRSIAIMATVDESEDPSLQDAPSMLHYVFILSFISTVDFGVLLPGLKPQVQALDGTEIEFGIIYGSYFLSHLIASFVFGVIVVKSPIKPLLITSASLLFLGNILYSLADTHTTLWLLAMGRVLTGISAAIVNAGYIQICRFTNGQTRVFRIMTFRWLELFGRIVGPAIGVLMGKCDVFFFLSINKYNIPSLLIAVLAGIVFLLIILEGVLKREQTWAILDMFSRSGVEEAASDSLLEARIHGSMSESSITRRSSALFAMLFCMGVAYWSTFTCFLPWDNNVQWSSVNSYLLFIVESLV